jgi:thioredoxin reductase (NADPH)
VYFCATCDGPFYRGEKELLVVGGGNSGFEESLFLSQFVDRIWLIDRNPSPKASLLLQAKVEEKDQISFHPNTEVVELNGDGKFQEVVVRDVESAETETWTPAAVFVYVGFDPNTQFLDGAVDLDQWGFVKTSPTFETSMTGVFATGDAPAGTLARQRDLVERLTADGRLSRRS